MDSNILWKTLSGIDLVTDIVTEKGAVISIRITHQYHSPWKVNLLSEGYLPKFFKQFKLVRELQIGDNDWDDAVYIVGDEISLVKLLQTYPELKESVHELIKNNYSLRISNSQITITCGATLTDYQQKSDFVGPHFDNIVRSLDRAKADGIKPTSPDQSAFFYFFVFALMALGIFSIIYGMNQSESNVISLRGDLGMYGAAIGVLLSPLPTLSWRFIRKLHSRSHYEFLLLQIVSTFSLLIIGSTTLYRINRTWDTSPPEMVTGEFSSKGYSRHKRGVSYHVTFRYHIPEDISFYQREMTLKLYVPYDFYEDAGETTTIPISVHQGYFKHPWIEHGRISF